jgi:pilus assembly protein CpaC
MFQVGGEFPILVPQSLGTSSVDFKKYGTQVDFVPIVLGNGRIRLEVRPRVSEIDESRNVTVGSSSVPGLRVREVETGVEMSSGQTLAIAGLVQTRVEAENLGLPFISEFPYIGAAFRRVKEQRNEVELLILVTPEFTEARDAQEMPPLSPGLCTTSPNDCELYLKGHLEVPNCCPANGGCANCPTSGSPTEAIPTPEGVERSPAPASPRTSTGRPSEEVAPLPTPTGHAAAGSPTARTAARTSYSPQNRYTSPGSQQSPAVSNSQRIGSEPNFIGPMGYELK